MLTALGEDTNRIVGLGEAFGPRIMRAAMFKQQSYAIVTTAVSSREICTTLVVWTSRRSNA